MKSHFGTPTGNLWGRRQSWRASFGAPQDRAERR